MSRITDEPWSPAGRAGRAGAGAGLRAAASALFRQRTARRRAARCALARGAGSALRTEARRGGADVRGALVPTEPADLGGLAGASLLAVAGALDGGRATLAGSTRSEG